MDISSDTNAILELQMYNIGNKLGEDFRALMQVANCL